MKQSSKRFLSLVISAAFVVAALIVFFDLVQPIYGDLETLKGQQLSVEQNLANEKTVVSQIQGLLSQYESGGIPTSTLALALPSGPDVAGALAQVYGIAEASGIAIQSVNVSSPAARLQTAAAAGAGLKPMGSFSLQVAASGSYEALKNFLTELETNIRIFDVTSLAIQPVGGATGAKGAIPTPDSFTYNIAVNTYYQLP